MGDLVLFSSVVTRYDFMINTIWRTLFTTVWVWKSQESQESQARWRKSSGKPRLYVYPPTNMIFDLKEP